MPYNFMYRGFEIRRMTLREIISAGPLVLEPHASVALTGALHTTAADVVTTLVHFYGPGDSMPDDGAERHSLPEKQRRFQIFLAGRCKLEPILKAPGSSACQLLPLTYDHWILSLANTVNLVNHHHVKCLGDR